MQEVEAETYSEWSALRWAGDVASGMCYLESRKLVHCDLKSALSLSIFSCLSAHTVPACALELTTTEP